MEERVSSRLRRATLDEPQRPCGYAWGDASQELKLWREMETGPADFLHAYWMGRYYGFLQ